MSPEHYRTKKYHIKDTRGDRFSNTVQSQHKQITNPSVTHDKSVKVLADCTKAINGVGSIDAEQDMHDMQYLAGKLGETQQDKRDTTSEQTPAPGMQSVPRVDT